jgi:Uma2 family endonuclease
MTVHGRPAHTLPADLSADDLLALRRRAPDYVPPPPAPVSWERLLAWLDEDTFAEWVDGEIIEMPPVRDEHQFILGFLYRLLMAVVEEPELGLVYLAPFKLHLPSRPSGREPDMFFLRSEHADRAHSTYVDGPADLVVEIVSRETNQRDYQVKRAEYETAGIPEYWVIDPLQKAATFYQLGENDRYRAARFGADGIYASRSIPGLRVRVSWLWQWPLPKLAAALADLPS